MAIDRRRLTEMITRLGERPVTTISPPGIGYGYALPDGLPRTSADERATRCGVVGRAGRQRRTREEHAVYLVRSGRVCIAGLNTKNVEATAVAMAAVMA